MRRLIPFLAGFAFALSGFRLAAADVPAPMPAASGPVAELSVRNAVVLGVIEGITEFLPISSTGHLIVADHAFQLDSDQPLKGQDGQPLWYKKPSEKNPGGEPLTLKLAADTYAVIIQAGAIAAVIFLYWKQLMGIALGLLGRNAAGMRLLRNLVCAFLPVAVIGLIAEKFKLEEKLFSVGAVVAAQVSGAVFMLLAERWRQKQSGPATSRLEPAELPAAHAAGIGTMQCLALWPGMSRSMVTIIGGYFAGLSPAKAAEFSFLVGLPVLGGAALVKAWHSGPAMIEVFGWPHVLLGIAVAAVTAAIAVKFLVSWLGRHGLGVFAIYRLLVAAVLVALFFT